MPGAITAARTGAKVDIAGVIGKGDFKVTGFARNAFHFTAGYQVDIRMPADLDQFG